MKTDPYYQRKRCSAMTVVSGNIRFMRTFAPFRGGSFNFLGDEASNDSAAFLLNKLSERHAEHLPMCMPLVQIVSNNRVANMDSNCVSICSNSANYVVRYMECSWSVETRQYSLPPVTSDVHLCLKCAVCKLRIVGALHKHNKYQSVVVRP